MLDWQEGIRQGWPWLVGLGALALLAVGWGIAQRRRLAAAGFDAFLIGEALLLADDPAEALAEILAEEGE